MASVDKIIEQTLQDRFSVAVSDSDVRWELFHSAVVSADEQFPRVLIRVHPAAPAEYRSKRLVADADVNIFTVSTDDTNHQQLDSMYTAVRAVIDDTEWNPSGLTAMYTQIEPGGKASLEQEGYAIVAGVFLPLEINVVE